MTRLRPMSGKECVRALELAGFRVIRQRGSHIYLTRDQPYAAVSVPAHRELGRGILRSIIRESGLTVEEFLALLD